MHDSTEKGQPWGEHRYMLGCGLRSHTNIYLYPLLEWSFFSELKHGMYDRLVLKSSMEKHTVKWGIAMSPLPSAGRPALPLLPVCHSSFNRNGRALLRPVGAIFSLTSSSKGFRSFGRS
jgi:hypothetical protein